jgi:hypothetical protein
MGTKSYVGHLSKEIACKQGAVRAVRFNGKYFRIYKRIMYKTVTNSCIFFI